MTASVNNAAASVASRLEAALLGGGDTETALRDVAAICVDASVVSTLDWCIA